MYIYILGGVEEIKELINCSKFGSFRRCLTHLKARATPKAFNLYVEQLKNPWVTWPNGYKTKLKHTSIICNPMMVSSLFFSRL